MSGVYNINTAGNTGNGSNASNAYTVNKETTININTILDRMGHIQNPNEPNVEGQTFVAPLSSQGRHGSLNKNMSQAPPKKTVPAALDWRKIIDKNTGQQVIRGPGTQFGCGCCYLIGVLQQLEDRIMLRSKKQAPYLSYTYVLTCNRPKPSNGSNVITQVSDGCGGGNPFEGAEYVAENGTIESLCSDFSFCYFNPGCAQGTNSSTQNNAVMPSCASQEFCQTCFNDKCTNTSNFVFRTQYFIDKSSIHALKNIDEIKTDVYTNGPCGATYVVPLDFILGGISNTKYPQATSWSQTNGIYINIPGADIYDMGLSPDKTTLVCDTFMGNHTVIIAGWGTDTVTNAKINGGKATPIDYWIVRNSWTSNWNTADGGFVKFAITNKELNINTELYLDNIKTVSGIEFGGGISVLPTEETLKRVESEPSFLAFDFDLNIVLNPVGQGSIPVGPLVASPAAPLVAQPAKTPATATTSLSALAVAPSNSPTAMAVTNAKNLQTTAAANDNLSLVIALSSVGGVLLIIAIVFIALFATKRQK